MSKQHDSAKNKEANHKTSDLLEIEEFSAAKCRTSEIGGFSVSKCRAPEIGEFSVAKCRKPENGVSSAS